LSKADLAGVAKDTVIKIHEAVQKLTQQYNLLYSIRNNKIKLADKVYVNGILSNIQDLAG
jgi:hypothetical protein